MLPALHDILQHPAIWRGGSVSAAPPGVATGFRALDEALPGGGWPLDALTEIFPVRPGIGELSLLTPALARLSREQARWIVLVAPPHVPYAPALLAAGIDLARLVVVRPQLAADALWATRQAISAGSCSAVIAWLTAPDMHSLRRLQLAAEASGTVAVLYRPACAAHDFSPAALKLALEPVDAGLAVHVLKRRGGRLPRPVVLDLDRDAQRRGRHAGRRPDDVALPAPSTPAPRPAAAPPSTSASAPTATSAITSAPPLQSL